MNYFSRQSINGFAIILIVILLRLPLQAQYPVHSPVGYIAADSVAGLYPHHSIADLKVLSDKLTKSLPDERDKFRAIYRWVCDNIENDYSLYTQNKRKREKLNDKPEALKEWNRKFTKRVTKKLLEDYSTVCTGYAYLIKELAYYADIDCKIIDGYGRTAHSNIGGLGYANHSWNAVQLVNTWYLCDATWSSGEIDTQKGLFIKKFNPGYFLADPELFVRNHYPLDTAWILMKKKPSLRTFLDGPLVYKNAFIYQILPLSPETFHITRRRGETLIFHFSKLASQQNPKVQLQVVQGSVTNSYFPQVHHDNHEHDFIEHIFNGKGAYDVHLLVNGDYVFTYHVEVVK